MLQKPRQRSAMFWEPLEGRKCKCHLCAHQCTITEGNVGQCRVRKNVDGSLKSLVYGMASSVAVDPIEKKPLYHFYPGSYALSLGTVGCNFRCLHCQNASISQVDASTGLLRDISADEVIHNAKRQGCGGLAWTYNEPTVWYEFTYEVSKLAKRENLYSVYVTNGYMAEEPLRELAPYLDGMNIDVKSFSDAFYRRICKARLEPVLNTCVLARELGIHIELTYLIIPEENDSREEITSFIVWVVNNLGTDVPLHFTRFFPDYMMQDHSATPLETLQMAYDAAREKGVEYVYVGNVRHTEGENTYCPQCHALLVERVGYMVSIRNLKDGRCENCGKKIAGVF